MRFGAGVHLLSETRWLNSTQQGILSIYIFDQRIVDAEGWDAAVGAFFSIFVAVVTLGMVVPYVTPTAHTGAVSAAILDSYTDRVVFYGVNQPSESDPLQEGTIRRQLKRLLKGFVQ